MSAAPPRAGDPAPLFVGRSVDSGEWWLSSAAGHYLVLCFLDSGVAHMAAALGSRATIVWLVRERFESDVDIVVDEDGRIAARYGFADKRGSVVLDRNLRVLDVVPFDDPLRHAHEIAAVLDAARSAEPGVPMAPALLVPRVFEPDFCRELIAAYDEAGGTDSGFVRSDAAGRTVAVVDHSHKRRRDLVLTDQHLRRGIKERVERRLVPEIRKAFQFNATRIERYIVACYDASDGGHFRPHRDNTTKGTAHRKFAVTINLNAEFEGGDLRFPEFGRHAYRAPVGGAIVFSCSMLHEATPVTAGRRYCTLPFLHDEAGEQVRRDNLRFVDQASGSTP